MPRMTFTNGNDALASEVNTYLMDQAVQTYATASARATALPTPTEGQLSYLNDVNRYEANHGGATWYPVAGQMPSFAGTNTGTISSTSGNKTTVTFSAKTERGITESAGLLTVSHTGWYSITGQISWASGTAANREIILAVGAPGALVEIAMNRNQMTSTTTYYLSIAATVYLTNGDNIRLQGNQTTGTLNMTGAIIPLALNAVMVSP